MKSITIKQWSVTIPEDTTAWRIEQALVPCTREMNAIPLKVNKATWERNRVAVQDRMNGLNAKCHAIAGETFRPNAPADCARILFDKMGYSSKRTTRSGATSVDQETLQILEAEGCELAGVIMEARAYRSMLSQLEAWEPYAIAGEVRPTWNQLGTPHGRYSADSPNIQNRVREIRQTIEAPEGYHLQSFDLGQAEYVTWASLSGDPTLSRAFTNGHDFHEQMYAEIRAAAPDVDLHETDPRQAGKTINFALLYLMKPHVLAQRLGITTAEATVIMTAYAARAPQAIEYRDAVLDLFHETGKTTTKFGRTREIKVPTTATQLHEVNKTAWHHHNAGTAAEILKLKQAKLHRALRAEDWKPEDARIALNMHDELILLVKDELKEPVTELGIRIFNEPIKDLLPFKVDHRCGSNWLSISK